MRRLLITVLVLYFARLFVVAPVFAVSSNAPPAAVPLTTPSIDYALPYPGMLPDSPFYFLKVARDRIMLWIIRDPIQRSFYGLLLADKRLAAGQVLINTGKTSLGVTTVSEAEVYFRQAVQEDLNVRNRDTADLTAKLTVSGSKHAEIINNLGTKLTGPDFDNLRKAYQDNQDSLSRVKELLVTPRR